jgi:hypothetical protein
MKRLRDARHPVNFFTYFRFVGGFILSMAWILPGFTSIPRLETRNPSNLPAGTPKVHLAGFNFIQNLLGFAKVSRRSSRRV